MSLHAQIKAQYEKFPYPSIPLLAKARPEDCHLMNYEAGLAASFGDCSMAAKKPRILVAGCGAFEPYIVALANPEAEIVALDFSSSALRKLRWRLLLRGVRGVQCVQANIEELPAILGKFHMIVATGVLHHLENPLGGLKNLEFCLEKNGVMRIMLYSKHGRNNIYKIRDLARTLQLSSGKELKKVIQRLPDNHPLKIHFHLYTDVKTEGGIRDGFLNIIDNPFDALEVEDFLQKVNLRATFFVHSPSGQPEHAQEFSVRKDARPWEKIAALDRISELESNFIFFAAREKDLEKPATTAAFRINPALSRAKAGRPIYSKVLGEYIIPSKEFRQLWKVPSFPKTALPSSEAALLEKALFVLPVKAP